MDIYVSHVNPVILIDNPDSLVLIFSCHLSVKLLNNRNKLWNNLLKILKGPLLKSLCKNSVVSVSAGLRYNPDSLVYLEALILNKNSDKLRDNHCGMCIIDLDYSMVIHLVEVNLVALELSDDELCTV